MSLDENRFRMTVPVTIKHEKRTQTGPFPQQLTAPFSREDFPSLEVAVRTGAAGREPSLSFD
jgi:hypothetical protein